jgi:hypothetical protein
VYGDWIDGVISGEQFWLREAKKLAWQVNFGWLVQRFMQIAVPACLVAACGILLLRSQGWEPAPARGSAVMLVAATVLLGCLVAWLMARHRFVSWEEGLIRLEMKLGLEGALSCALAGVGEWPAGMDRLGTAPAGFRWRLTRAVLPGLLALGVLAASLVVPLGSHAKMAIGTEEPAAWGQMEDWLETLEEEEVVDPESAQQVRERIEQLRDRPEAEWFSHHSLEAGDSLKEALGQTIESMGLDLETAEQALAALQSAGTGAAEDGFRKQLAEQYQEAAERLKASALRLDPELMAQLAQLDPSQLQQLDPQALEELRERLRKASGS